jgi:tetratricopeptide (TPR) repeat protein
MGREDWYRKKTWTPQDREDFWMRLKRSRSAFNKAQYTRIQSVELLATKKPELVEPALELLDTVLRDWPDETSQLASTHQHRAECLVLLGRADEAVAEYRKVFEQQRRIPSWRTGAHLDFAWLVARKNIVELYDEALSALREFGGNEMFPFQIYIAAAAYALIADQRGDAEGARSWAMVALGEAAKTHTGFRYHPTLGLVDKPPDEEVHLRLKHLASKTKPTTLLGLFKWLRS